MPMLNIKKFSCFIFIFVFLFLSVFPVYADEGTVTGSLVEGNLGDWFYTQSNMTPDTGNTFLENTYEINVYGSNYSDRVTSFYRFAYKSLFKCSKDVYAYRIRLTPRLPETTMQNIQPYRGMVGTMDDLMWLKGVTNAQNPFTADLRSSYFYINNYLDVNLYYAIIMYCHFHNRTDGTMLYPSADWYVYYEFDYLPYTRDDLLDEILSSIDDNGDTLLGILDELIQNNVDNQTIYNELLNLRSTVSSHLYSNGTVASHTDSIRKSFLSLLTKIDTLNSQTDELEQLLANILNSLNSTSDKTVDNMKTDEFSSILSGDITNGGSAIGSLPDIDVSGNQSGFSWFQKCFTDLFNSIPELTTLLTVVLTLGFIGYVLGRQLNKGG